MKYAVSPEGVQALNSMSSSTRTSISSLVASINSVMSSLNEYSGSLGPHHKDILESLKDITDSIKQNENSINDIANILDTVANNYQGVIDKKLNAGGNQSGNASGGAGGLGSGGTGSGASGAGNSNGLNEHGVQSIESIKSWIGSINPNPNNDFRREINCGKCAAAVEKRFNGDNTASAGFGTYSIDEMNSITGKTQTRMTPEKIKDYIISQGPGSHAVVGVDRGNNQPGHWFNIYYDGNKVYTIDGQVGTISDWPPNYGNVTVWDVSI